MLQATTTLHFSRVVPAADVLMDREAVLPKTDIQAPIWGWPKGCAITK